jgi:ABC-type branched-subunit amino acid transport system substrate-binding protein
MRGAATPGSCDALGLRAARRFDLRAARGFGPRAARGFGLRAARDFGLRGVGPLGAVVAVLAACGAPAQGSWIERDARDQPHATAPARAPAAAIDPARIEAADEDALTAAIDGAGAPVGRIALRLARLAHHRGDDRRARTWLERARQAPDGDAQAIAALLAALPTGKIDPAVIGVLLPLSGPYRAIGEELRVAIELAPAAGTRWLFVDSQAGGAAAAVDAAVAGGAIGLLGPVGQREAIDAARAAALAGVPIALLAPADGADPSAGVFRVVASPADEGRAVAQLAAQDNFPTVAVLAPRDDLGREAADGFVAEATRLGLQVTARGEYDPTGGDVEPDVKAFLGLTPASNPRLAAHLARHGKKGWTTFSPDIPYTLLYVPDRYDRAAIIAAYLPYYNVELRTTQYLDPAQLAKKHAGHLPQVVQLVGGAGWHHPSLPVRGGAPVQGALIVDDFAAELGGDLAVQLTEAFQARTRRAPSTAAAQAYDAAALIAAARAEAAAAPDPRAALRNALAHARLADGACGPAAIGPDGELERTPSLLSVEGDQLILAP